jgi:hypothetical protein
VKSPRSTRRWPSPALVLALAAIVLSLVGSAYAGIQLGRNSVGTFQLRDGAVTAKKIRNGAVTAAKVRGCPSNTLPIGPGCVEAGLRPAAGYSEAVATCAGIEGRLPLVAELAGIAALGRPIGDPELVGEGTTRQSQTVLYSDARQTTEEPINTARRFRCVISPT